VQPSKQGRDRARRQQHHAPKQRSLRREVDRKRRNPSTRSTTAMRRRSSVGPGAWRGHSSTLKDLLHDIFSRRDSPLHEFRGEARVTTWLFRITQQVVRWRRRNDAVQRWLWGRTGQDLLDARTGVPTPIEEIERREQNLRLYAGAGPPARKVQDTLVLFAMEGMSGDRSPND